MTRKIGVTQMAFYRGWLQGLPLRQVADMYLETGLDLRLAKSTLTWVQDTLRRAALRHGHQGEARLLRLRISAVRPATQDATLPSIDDFREAVDPDDFYSFDELMKLYLERYPGAGNDKAKKRAKLLERQIRALNWIESLLVTAPVPEDVVEAWLDPTIASRLQSSGIVTLGDLIKRMIDHGYRWYKTVNQLGERRALRLAHWIEGYHESLGTLPPTVLKPPHTLKAVEKARSPILLSGPAADPNAPAIVPLDALILPRRGPDQGSFERPLEASRIRATNDTEAVHEWLNAKAGSLSTQRAYMKEAERLVLWAMLERGLTLAQVKTDDCAAYRDWLCGLGRIGPEDWPFRIPQAQWMAPRYTKRYSPLWRPFEGPLSAKSVRYALTVVNAFCTWLAGARYIAFNPWQLIAKPRALAGDAPDTEFVRALSRAQWDYLVAGTEMIEDPIARRRACLLLRLALVTGMRLSELAGAVYGHVYSMPLKDGFGERWMLKVLGKGGKWRAVPLTDDVVDLMRKDLRERGLADDPRAVVDSTAIVTRLDGGAMSNGGLAKLVKGLFERAEASLKAEGKRAEARVFSDASVHWIRHTTGSLLGNSGVPPSIIQKLLGHASIATTTIYTDTSEDQLWQSVTGTL